MTKWWPIFWGVVVVLVFSLYPIRLANSLCCLGLAVGGLQASVVTAKNQGLQIETTHAIRLGALVGLVAAVIMLLVNMLFQWVFASTTIALDPIPQFGYSFLVSLLEGFFSIAGEAPTWSLDGGPGAVGRFFVQLPVNALFAGIGGAIGASLFRQETPISS